MRWKGMWGQWTAQGDTISLPHGPGTLLGTKLAVNSTQPSTWHDQEGQKRKKGWVGWHTREGGQEGTKWHQQPKGEKSKTREGLVTAP